MAMRNWVCRGRSVMESTRNRGGFGFSRLLSDKGRVLKEEEQAKENVYIQKWEREKLEKQKTKPDNNNNDDASSAADKKPEGVKKG